MSVIDAAIEQVRSQFAGHPVTVAPDGDGVSVVVDNVHVGDQYEPSATWFGFRLGGGYPSTDVYPHYVGRVARVDGAAPPEAVQSVVWQQRDAWQLSRANRGWNPRRDNAAIKAQKVLTWFAAL